MWNYIHLLYSKDGELNGCKPGLTNMFVIFLPGINTILSFNWIIRYPIPNEERDFNKFFKID